LIYYNGKYTKSFRVCIDVDIFLRSFFDGYKKYIIFAA